MSPESAIRLGSASSRMRPFCSSALSLHRVGSIRRLVGRPGSRTGCAGQHAGRHHRRNRRSVEGNMFGPPMPAPFSAGCWKDPFGAVTAAAMPEVDCRHWPAPIGRTRSIARPIRGWPAREASMKRTSSMICCACVTSTVLMMSGANCRAICTALSSVTASGDLAAEHDAAVDRGDPDAAAGCAGDFDRQPGNVIGHLDVEDADRLLVLVVDRDARSADLLAEDRDRMVGQRTGIGNIRIADRRCQQRSGRCARPATCRW